MIITRTPFRISFFGGGTDYPVWFNENGGRVLTSTINKYCYISARYLPPFFNAKNRIVWSKIESVDRVDEIQHPVVRAGLQYLNMHEGLEIHHDGDLPARSGLGSSSAFTVGFLHALYALKGQMTGKAKLANEAIYLEQNLLKEAVGVQDQIAVSYGGINLVEINCDGSYIVKPVILSTKRVRELQSHLLLFFTGISRYSFEVAQKQILAIPSKKQELKVMAEMVDTALDILTGAGSIADFGTLLHESWMLKRGMSDAVSSEEIDRIYTAARDAGATGGKILGAGGGGFMLLCAPPATHQKIRESLLGLLEVPFEFERTGTQIIFADPDQIQSV